VVERLPFTEKPKNVQKPS
jgi:hypothetical protein